MSFMDIPLRHSTWKARKVTNSSNGFTNLEFRNMLINIFLWFLLQLANWVGQIRSFFQLLKLSKLCGKKLVKKIVENIWRTRYRIRLFLCIFNRFSLPLVHRSERNMVFRVPISCEGHNFKFLSKLIDDRYQFFSTCNKYFRFKHDL